MKTLSLIILAGILSLLSLMNCMEGNITGSTFPRPPVITIVNISNNKPSFGERVHISVEATDPNNDELSYLWLCPSGAGTLSSTDQSEVFWTAPFSSTSVSILLYVRDGYPGHDTTQTITLSPVSAVVIGPASTPAPIPLWGKTYGNFKAESANKLKQTSDGGWIVVGEAFIEKENKDIWVLKLTVQGDVEWQKLIGGTGKESALDVIETSDGGFLVAGFTGTNDDTLPENPSDWTDCWLIKLDNTGEIEWQNVYGEDEFDYANCIIEVFDGYVMGGYGGFGPGGDLWLVKVDKTGDFIWRYSYGGPKGDDISRIVETGSGGFLLGGCTASYGAGDYDIWLLETNSTGGILWEKTYGGEGRDYLNDIIRTSDGGYLVTGATESFGFGDTDLWVIKLFSDGTPGWQYSYGGYKADEGYYLSEVPDGKIVVIGSTESCGKGEKDIWVLLLNGDGTISWQKTIGDVRSDIAKAVVNVDQGGFMLAGETSSFGDILADVLLFTMDMDGNSLLPGSYSFMGYRSTNVSGNITKCEQLEGNGELQETEAVARDTLCIITDIE